MIFLEWTDERLTGTVGAARRALHEPAVCTRAAGILVDRNHTRREGSFGLLTAARVARSQTLDAAEQEPGHGASLLRRRDPVLGLGETVAAEYLPRLEQTFHNLWLSDEVDGASLGRIEEAPVWAGHVTWVFSMN